MPTLASKRSLPARTHPTCLVGRPSGSGLGPTRRRSPRPKARPGTARGNDDARRTWVPHENGTLRVRPRRSERKRRAAFEEVSTRAPPQPSPLAVHRSRPPVGAQVRTPSVPRTLFLGLSRLLPDWRTSAQRVTTRTVTPRSVSTVRVSFGGSESRAGEPWLATSANWLLGSVAKDARRRRRPEWKNVFDV